MAPDPSGEVTGVLNVNKPCGITSHDVVARIRRIAGQKAVGHAGTLDPLAAGVLILLLGRATGLSNFAANSTKVYAAEIAFGAETETDDAEGEITRSAALPSLSVTDFAGHVNQLTGEVMQVPPMYSAVKRDGKKAYVVARKGGALELSPRRVTVYSIAVVSWCSPRLRLVVTTGPGTYIRSLARDLGRLLESAAYLHSLVRLRSGDFSYDDATPLDRLDRDHLLQACYPADVAVQSLFALSLSEAESMKARHGAAFSAENIDSLPLGNVPPPDPVRIYAHNGEFIGLAHPLGTRTWKPFKVLLPA